MDLSKARRIFFEEARELCDALENALLDPQNHPPGIETYNLLFRTAHTIKGSAGIFGLEALVRFAHAVENVLERLRIGQLPLSEDLVSLLLASNDHLRQLLLNAAVSEAQASLDLPEGLPLLSSLQGFAVDAAAAGLGNEALAAEPATVQATAPVESHSASAVGAGVGGGGKAAQSPLWHLCLRFHADTFREGFDPLCFLHYLRGIATIVHIEPVWRAWPPVQVLDATECFMGFDLSLESSAEPDKIRGTFEFVEEDSLIGILPPGSLLSDFRDLAERLNRECGEMLAEQLARWVRLGALSYEEAVQVEIGQFNADIQADSSASASDQVSPGAPIAALTSNPTPSPAQASTPAEPTKLNRSEGLYIRIEAAKLDRLINRVGELVIAASATQLIAQSRGDAELLESVAINNHLVESIRDDALTLRMVPVEEVFSRFPRMVREVSKQLGKPIKLEIKGADTEIDKSMVEILSDPLMHIVRNALDHGIESAARRDAAGKPEIGTVTLNAYHDAGSVVVEVMDDGGGIDRARVLAKAQERGLIGDARQMSDQEILQLVFLPGFTTAEAISDLSGRGVGMDVVKRNIEALRGEIEIISKPGQGSSFRLRLPLTLAIIDGFRVEVDSAALVMPLDMMIECIDMPAGAMHQHVRQVNLRGEWLPFVSLRELFGLAEASGPEFVVIVHYGESRAGIVVDRLMGEVQAVIKPLGELFKTLRGISGSTILGNGKPALILDIPQLIQHAWRRERRQIRQSDEALVMLDKT